MDFLIKEYLIVLNVTINVKHVNLKIIAVYLVTALIELHGRFLIMIVSNLFIFIFNQM